MKNYFKSKIGLWLGIIYIVLGAFVWWYSFNICTAGLECAVYMAPIVFPGVFIFDSFFIFIFNLILWYTLGYIIDIIKNRK
jgi:hypothetical protein